MHHSFDDQFQTRVQQQRLSAWEKYPQRRHNGRNIIRGIQTVKYQIKTAQDRCSPPFSIFQTQWTTKVIAIISPEQISVQENSGKDTVFMIKDKNKWSRDHSHLKSTSNTRSNTINGPLPVLMFKSIWPADMEMPPQLMIMIQNVVLGIRKTKIPVTKE